MASRRALSLSTRKRRRATRRLVLLLLACVLLVAGTFVLLWLPVARVQHITVVGIEGVEAGSIVATIEREIHGRLAFILPQDSIALVAPRALERTLKAQNPSLATAEVSRTSLTDISVRVSKRTPFALWCRAGEDAKCFFIDEGGFIFAHAPRFLGTPYFRYIGRGEGEEPLGEQFLPESVFRDLTFFISAIKKLRLEPVSLALLGSEDYAITLESGARIVFARTQNLTDVYENLEAALRSDALAKGLSAVDYLDLRFGNKVYFKEKGAE